ncbi:protein transport protein Sec24C [Trypanosoma rangeli SC58]|uniref:Protein transport protein Sec24C n=1 Tax=Trypanosoma rangeli SC58 TaxID=429131 RepID=A0A061IXQ7_TRYRA|nr:protein transport protein Sec24C [Trypanosoma rangeli SC58]
MYDPYGSAQRPEQPYYYPQGQQQQQPTQAVPSLTSWPQYTHPQYGAAPPPAATATATADAALVNNGAAMPAQYHDPYAFAPINGVQDHSNYYPVPNYAQQPQPPPLMPQQPPMPPQHQIQPQQQQTAGAVAASVPALPFTGAAPALSSRTDAGGSGLPTARQVEQTQQRRPSVGSFSPTHSFSQREQCASPIGRCARPPPKRSVDLKSAPNPRRDIPQRLGTEEIYTSSGQLPLSATGFIAVDDGNANPKFFRPTANSVPAEERLVKDSNVFFGAVLAPLCRPLHPREEVPLVEGRPPVRCHRCRAYISCHVRFTDMGRYWLCPFCSMSNEVGNEDFCNLDARGQRLDREERPELSRGSVEYDVGPYEEYALRDEKDAPIAVRPLHYLFLLDVSQKAIAKFLPDYVDALMRSLHEMAEYYPQCRVAFITYAATLHFYNVRHPRIPQLIVADVDNPFVPLPFTSLCWLTLGTDLDLVDAFLMRVLEYAEDLMESDCVDGGRCPGCHAGACGAARRPCHSVRTQGTTARRWRTEVEGATSLIRHR